MALTRRTLAGGAVLAALLGAAGLAGFLWLAQEPSRPLSPIEVNIGEMKLGGPFTLTDQHGRRVTSAEVIDGPALLYFGYTFCPDVCPVDVAVIAEAVDLLARRGIEVKPVFITVDPARDTPEALAYWAEAMHPKMVALTGTPEEIAAVAKAYKVYYKKVEVEGSEADYLMNHTTFTYLVTPDGVRAVLRREASPEEMADVVAAILAGS